MSIRRFFSLPTRLVVKRSFVFLLTMSFILSWSLPGARAMDMREIEGQSIFVNANATGANNGTSWTDAYLSLQDALSASISGDQIWVAAGTYTPGPEGSPRTVTFQLVAGVVVYGGFAGNETSLDQRNWNTNVTILSGDLNDDDSGFTNNDENSYHVLTGTVGDDAAILDGVTILGGNANGGDLNDSGGGMLNISGGDLTLANIAFSGNTAETGGGMYNYMSSPILINVTFDGNAANGGGGIYNYESCPTLSGSLAN